MTRDETRGAEAARMAAVHNLTGTADPLCWTDVAAENRQLRAENLRLRKLLAETLPILVDNWGEDEKVTIAVRRAAIGQIHTQESFKGDR